MRAIVSLLLVVAASASYPEYLCSSLPLHTFTHTCEQYSATCYDHTSPDTCLLIPHCIWIDIDGGECIQNLFPSTIEQYCLAFSGGPSGETEHKDASSLAWSCTVSGYCQWSGLYQACVPAYNLFCPSHYSTEEECNAHRGCYWSGSGNGCVGLSPGGYRCDDYASEDSCWASDTTTQRECVWSYARSRCEVNTNGFAALSLRQFCSRDYYGSRYSDCQYGEACSSVTECESWETPLCTAGTSTAFGCDVSPAYGYCSIGAGSEQRCMDMGCIWVHTISSALRISSVPIGGRQCLSEQEADELDRATMVWVLVVTSGLVLSAAIFLGALCYLTCQCRCDSPCTESGKKGRPHVKFF